jgi:hypothetical protein
MHRMAVERLSTNGLSRAPGGTAIVTGGERRNRCENADRSDPLKVGLHPVSNLGLCYQSRP